MTTKNKKTAFYTALAKAPGLLKEYIKQYTQGQIDFPDELVEAFTQAQGDIRKIEQMCNNLKKSKEGAQIMKVAEQVYNAAQQEIDAEVNNSTGLFKDGGKVDYLRKLAGGGNTEKNNNSDNKKKSSQNKSVAKRRDLNSPEGFYIVEGIDENGDPVDVATPQAYGFGKGVSSEGPVRHTVSYVYPIYNRSDGHVLNDSVIDEARGQVIYEDTFGKRDTSYFNLPDYHMMSNNGYKLPVGSAPDQEAAKKLYYQFLEYVNPQDYPEVKKAKAEKHNKGGFVGKGLKWLLGKSDDMARTSKAARIPSEEFSTKPTDFDIDKVFIKGPRDLDIDRVYMNPAMIAQPKRIPNSNIDNIRYKGIPDIPMYDIPTFKMSDDVQKLLDGIKSGKIKLTK